MQASSPCFPGEAVLVQTPLELLGTASTDLTSVSPQNGRIHLCTPLAPCSLAQEQISQASHFCQGVFAASITAHHTLCERKGLSYL